MEEQHNKKTGTGSEDESKAGTTTGKVRPRKKLNKAVVIALVIAGILVLLACVYYLLCYLLVMHLQLD